jgi:AAA domain/RepB DNA-primase from phage plasmid
MSAYNQYKTYLETLFKLEDTACFVAIEHNKDRDKAKEKVLNRFVSVQEAITPEFFQILQKVNDGRISDIVGNSKPSIYVGMNTYPASLIGSRTGRTQENVVAVRALYADVDNNGKAVIEKMGASDVIPPPSIVLESSPGKFQGMWPVDGISKEEAKPLLKAMSQDFETDSAVAEVARILRVPGFKNHKYADAPEVKVVQMTSTRYTRGDFKLTVKPKEFEKKPEGWLDAPFIHKGGPYGGIDNQVCSFLGHYITAKNIKDPEVLYSIIAGHIEKNGCFETDGVTEYPCKMERVKELCQTKSQEWPTGEEKYGYKIQMGQPAAPSTAPASAVQQTVVDVSKWMDQFRSIEEMEDGEIDMVIEGVLQEGTCFIGATPGDGKTLIGLSLAKAICQGLPLFGLPQFTVKKPRTVIYLIPESRDRAFRRRCEKFRVPKNDKMKFMCRTMSSGVPLELNDPHLLEAVKQTKAVVFLDTAARFMKGGDENSSAQNRLLVNDVITLLAAGAVCVVLLHHATKASATEAMTLENMLRGTSDFAAMCDQAYGIRKDRILYAKGAGPMEIDIENLKDREQIGGLTTLRLAASHKNQGEDFVVSYIDETGDFKVIDNAETFGRTLRQMVAMVKDDPIIPVKDMVKQFGMTDYAVKTQLGKMGWHRVQGGPGGASPWHQDNGQPCPFAKPTVAPPATQKPPKATIADAADFLA